MENEHGTQENLEIAETMIQTVSESYSLAKEPLHHAELIRKMTLEEKASLLSGKNEWQSQNIERLDIPSMFLADGPHGIRRQAGAADHLGLNPSIEATCFPPAATVANSWDVTLGEQIGICLGTEAAAQAVNVLLGPGINIKRNPLCGRNFEYFSEDPYLAGKLGAAYIHGIQLQGVSACVKHFAVNNQETRRMTVNAVVDERTLRELYLTAFEIAIKEGDVKTVMSAYNQLNGTYTNENKHLMLDILRSTWEFSGCVVTDWGGCNDRVAGLVAGNELEMPTTGGETDREVVAAVRSGQIPEAVVDAAVDRLLDLMDATSEAVQEPRLSFDVDEHHAMAQQAAAESIVLLKNEDEILPLQDDVSVVIIGNFAANPRYQGAGSSVVNPTQLDTTLECLAGSGIQSAGYAPGFERHGGKNLDMVREACELAQNADVVLLYLGLDEITEAEGIDRKNMSMPENQIKLLDAIHEVNPNIVVVLSCGSPVEMPWISKVKGLVHGYLGGQAGASAMLRVLTGEVNPSGKLAESYPLRYEDCSSANHFPGGEATVEYREGLFVGYRYYDTAGVEVLFPFGFGLSYTSFEYSDLDVGPDSTTVTLTNTGAHAGKEIVQLYVGRENGDIFRPEKELKGFTKVALGPGEQKQVTIPFDDKTFRYFNTATNCWETESGTYRILVGASSEDIRLQDTMNVTGSNAPAPYVPERLTSYYTGQAADVLADEFEHLLGCELPPASWDRERELGYNDSIAQLTYARSVIARLVPKAVLFTHKILRRFGKRETADLLMTWVYNLPFRGIARMSGGTISISVVDGLLIMINGRFLKGLRHAIRAWRQIKKEEK